MRVFRIGYRIRTSGWVFITVWALVQLAAFNTGENLLYLIASGSLAFLLVSALLTYATLFRVKVSRHAPETVHRGEPFGVLVRVRNMKSRLSAWYLQIASDRQFLEPQAFVARVPNRSEAEFRVMHTLSRRGIRPLPSMRIRSAFPLGLFERTCSLDEQRSILVLPRILRLSRRALDQVEHMGSVSHRWERDGEEYFALREYVPGDDPRMISWRVSARKGELIVREMDPGTSRAVVIEFDPRVPEDYSWDEFEECVDLAASMASSFLEHENQVSLSLPGQSIPLGLGHKHLLKILKALALVEPVLPGTDLSAMVEDADWAGAARVVIAGNPARWGERLERGRVLNPMEAIER